MNRGLNYFLNLNDGNFGRGMDMAYNKTNALDNAVNKVVGSLAVMFTVDKFKDLAERTTEVYSKTQAYDNVLKFASKNAEDYGLNQQFIKQTITDMKLPLMETTDGFSKLLGAMKGTSLEGDAARKIFKGTSEAITVMHLDAATANSVYYALQNIMSKGKLQAQELTLQLGNALPGAQKLAAESMGMTTAELMKQMEQGNIAADVFLPKFAARLHEVYGPGMQNAVHSLTGRMNDANNAILMQESALGERLSPIWVGYLELQGKGLGMIGKVIDFVERHSGAMKVLAGTIGLAAGAYVVTIGLQKAAAWYTGLSTAAIILNTAVTEGWTAAQVALNIAMEANPVGAVIVAIGLLGIAIAGIIDQYEQLESKYKSGIEVRIKKAKDEEKDIVTSLAKSYEKQGLGKEAAQKRAIDVERENLDASISNYKSKLSKAKVGSDEYLGLRQAITAAEAQKSSLRGVFGSVDTGKDTAGLPGKTPKTSGAAVGTGSTTRNVVVNITNLVKELSVHAATVKESGRDIEKEMTNILVRALHDAEVAIG